MLDIMKKVKFLIVGERKRLLRGEDRRRLSRRYMRLTETRDSPEYRERLKSDRRKSPRRD